jgi:2-keto-4-pentenoate hydratase
MDDAKAARAAELLLQARASGNWLQSLPQDLQPQSVEQAYAIQDRVIAQLGTVGGWKVGARSIDATPNCAPLAQHLIFADGAALPASLLRLRGVEAEIGFKLAADLPPRARPFERDEVAGYIESVHPTLEIVESRYVDFRNVDALSVLADFNSNGALIVGAKVAQPARATEGSLSVSLRFSDQEKVRATDGNPAVDLLRLLAWLANHCAARCGGLRRGQIITTGSHNGMQFAEPGVHVAAEFFGVGTVTAQL